MAEDLRVILPALAATQAHATARLLEMAREDDAGPYLTPAEAAKLTGYSRSFLYAHGERLGIAVRPMGAPMRFPQEWVRRFMEKRERG